MFILTVRVHLDFQFHRRKVGRTLFVHRSMGNHSIGAQVMSAFYFRGAHAQLKSELTQRSAVLELEFQN